jgi:hypothetical protein
MSRIRLLPVVVLALVALLAPPAHAAPIEDYASYEPQTRCSPKAKPGTVYLARWVARKYGGSLGPISRPCGGGTSEHSEGRAFDWMVSARKKADRQRVDRFLELVFRTRSGEAHAWARRMGIMYVIWDDRMWAAYDTFRPKAYLSSSCRTRKRCSDTLRHRNHVHVSLTRAGGKGTTSWYAGRLG